jgi:hypothetical protein
VQLRAGTLGPEDTEVIIVGSQAILGSYTEDELPEAALASIEADLTFFDDNDYDNDKSDLVDMHIGEDSHFHGAFGYYVQGREHRGHQPAGWAGSAGSSGSTSRRLAEQRQLIRPA